MPLYKKNEDTGNLEIIGSCLPEDRPSEYCTDLNEGAGIYHYTNATKLEAIKKSGCLKALCHPIFSLHELTSPAVWFTSDTYFETSIKGRREGKAYNELGYKLPVLPDYIPIRFEIKRSAITNQAVHLETWESFKNKNMDYRMAMVWEKTHYSSNPYETWSLCLDNVPLRYLREPQVMQNDKWYPVSTHLDAVLLDEVTTTYDESIVTSKLFSRILAGYQLARMGIHGITHWERVHEIGEKLAVQTGADSTVVKLFSVFHDARRLNDGHDPNHGKRGAELAKELYRHGYFQATDNQMNILCRACEGHTKGKPEDANDITVATCWDADRLDLLRVGITPNPAYLCTQAARKQDMIDWACSLRKNGPEPDTRKLRKIETATTIHYYYED